MKGCIEGKRGRQRDNLLMAMYKQLGILGSIFNGGGFMLPIKIIIMSRWYSHGH